MDLQQFLQHWEIIKFKYASQETVIRFLMFLNNIWDGEEPSESWQKAVIIPVHKNGNNSYNSSAQEWK
jgi:type IV secretory pathway VirB4 component